MSGNRDSLPWTRKHFPDKREDWKIHMDEFQEVERFLSDYPSQKEESIMLHGPTGIGKTSMAYSLAGQLGLEVSEMNGSDYRDKKSLDSMVGLASQQRSLFGRGKLILIDEVDALSGKKDRGAVTEMSKIIKKSSFPVIMTALDPWNSKLSPLRKVSRLIELKEIGYKQMMEILKGICDKEGITYEETSLNLLARKSGSDVRAAINDLQQCSSSGQIQKKDVEELTDRNKVVAMPKSLQMIFKSKDYDVLKNAFNEVDEDYDKVMLWLDENLPKEYGSPEEINRAYDNISKADIFRGRIRRRQYWRFLVYINMYLSIGIGFSKRQKSNNFTKYKPPSRLLKIWISNRKNMKRNAIARKIAEMTHTSMKDAVKEFGFYRILAGSEKFLDRMKDDLDLEDDEIEYLKKHEVRIKG